MQDDQTRGPESLGAEIDSDSTKRRDEFVTGIICWKRGRCGRMCRDPVHWMPSTNKNS